MDGKPEMMIVSLTTGAVLFGAGLLAGILLCETARGPPPCFLVTIIILDQCR